MITNLATGMTNPFTDSLKISGLQGEVEEENVDLSNKKTSSKMD